MQGLRKRLQRRVNKCEAFIKFVDNTDITVEPKGDNLHTINDHKRLGHYILHNIHNRLNLRYVLSRELISLDICLDCLERYEGLFYEDVRLYLHNNVPRYEVRFGQIGRILR